MDTVYENLESSMLGIDDYKDIPAIDNLEPLVAIVDMPNLTAEQRGEDMKEYTGDLVYVREGVLSRLGAAAGLLTQIEDNLSLNVTYGYRALQVQTRGFERAKSRFESQLSGEELDRAAHRLTARPDVAGHPTGGAIDIQIIHDSKPIDFGTKVDELVPDSYTFSPFVERKAMRNRMLLRSVMMGTGFAPFDGEWWHFSYGDKEWARSYRQPFAVYSQLNFQPDMIASDG